MAVVMYCPNLLCVATVRVPERMRNCNVECDACGTVFRVPSQQPRMYATGGPPPRCLPEQPAVKLLPPPPGTDGDDYSNTACQPRDFLLS